MSSGVWAHFSISTKDPKYAVCKHCSKNISRGGKSHTTSAMNKHLKLHPRARENYDKFVREPEEMVDCPGTDPVQINSIDGGSKIAVRCGASEPANKCARLSQPTLKTFIGKYEKFKPGDQRSAKITNLVCEMICLDNQPLSVVENEGFKTLINHLEPRYVLPTRKNIANVIIPELYLKTLSRVKNIVEEAEFVSITMDLWTSAANDDYLGVTLHFVDCNFVARHICIEVVPFPEISHTAENICTFLQKILLDWNVSTKVFVVVTDNARNVVAALTQSNLSRISCLAHSLQLVVKECVINSKVVFNVIGTCRRIVGHFKHSAHATKILKKAQQTVGAPAHRLIQDEPTRCNSSLHMLERLLEQKGALALAASELSNPTELSANQWELIRNVIPILKIFDHATLQVSKASVTISEAIPIVNSLLQELKKPAPPLSGLQGIKNDLQASMVNRFSSIEQEKEYALSSLLDPRFKGAAFMDNENLTAAVSLLTAEANELPDDNHPPGTVLAHDEAGPSSTSHGMWALYSQILTTGTENVTAQGPRSSDDEVKLYLSLPKLNSSKNVLEYWQSQSTDFPRLQKLAKKYLSAPSATVFSERLFSAAGNICDKKRNRLDPERVKMLVFLNKNLKQ